MVGYVTLGTNNLPRAVAFYDALLGELGGKRFIETERLIAWAGGPGTAALSVVVPYDGKPATVGNGVMVALATGSREKVDAIYAKAMSLGAMSEGEPGPRGDNFYAGYFRDLDGNKLNVFFMG